MEIKYYMLPKSILGQYRHMDKIKKIYKQGEEKYIVYYDNVLSMYIDKWVKTDGFWVRG